MAIEFQCPSCNKVFRVEDKFGGKTAKCPGCESQIQIPAASATQEPPAVPHVDTSSPPPEQPSAQKTAPQKPTEVPPFMAAESSSPKPSAAPEINPFAATTAAAAAPTSASVPRGKLVGWLALLLSCALLLVYLPGSPAALIWPYEWLILLGWCLLGLLWWVDMSHCRD